MTIGSRRPVHRRRFLASAGALLAAPAMAGMPIPGALAQQTGQAAPLNPYRELGAIAAEAERLGLSVPRLSAGVEGGTDFDKLMPAIVDFMDNIKASAKASAVSPADLEALLDRTSALLQQLNRAERSPADRHPMSGAGAATAARPQFGDIAKVIWSSSTIVRSASSTQPTSSGASASSPIRTIASSTTGFPKRPAHPRYFIGIIHAMEASFDFRTHLHNGDPLKAKTVQVPSGRPPVWNPPNDWASSALDAITLADFADQPDWSLARTLYNWEGYNGWRSRARGINTPYLWSFSNHYGKGKLSPTTSGTPMRCRAMRRGGDAEGAGQRRFCCPAGLALRRLRRGVISARAWRGCAAAFADAC